MPGAAAAELACFLTTRSETFHLQTFFAGLAAITLCVFLLPLLVTGTWAFGAASEECFDRTFARKNVTRWDVDSQYYDPSGTWTMMRPGTSFPSTPSIPRPWRCLSLACGYVYSSARTWARWTWTAHVRRLQSDQPPVLEIFIISCNAVL